MERKIKILFLNTQFSFGGASLIARTIFLNSLQEFESTLLYGYDNRGRKSKETKINNVGNISTLISFIINKISHKIFGIDIYTSRKTTLFKQIDNADIIHIHNIHTHFLNYGCLLKYLITTNKKIIWTIHDSWILTGRCALPLQCENWKNKCDPCSFTDYYPGSLCDLAKLNFTRKQQLFSAITENNLIIVSPSEWLEENVRLSSLNRFRVTVIPNGIDLDVFQFKRKNFYTPVKVLFISNFVNDKVKSPEMFFRIVKECPHINFITIGRGAKTILPNLEHRGYLNSPIQIVNELHSATFLLFLSIFDNYSTVLLEALACGTPVVSFRGKSNEEILKDAGFIFNDNDVDAIINFFNELKIESIKEILEGKVKKGRELVENRNSLQSMLEKYFSLYKAI
ncbi:MAG: glycosyltransferase [Alphaproteobacteria bacterium]|nr:glycosyltransferase [Alphaproteobacteria bacterium]